jgi:hypothetical protein
VLVYEFVNGEREHRERCAVCSARSRWCRPLTEALEEIIEWRRGRVLYNKALYLRASQDIAEAARA